MCLRLSNTGCSSQMATPLSAFPSAPTFALCTLVQQPISLSGRTYNPMKAGGQLAKIGLQ